jgi:hypothetical protein
VRDHSWIYSWVLWGLGAALVLALFIQIAKGDGFRLSTFVGRVLVSIVIVVVAAPLLFLGWCFCAMGNIGCINC